MGYTVLTGACYYKSLDNIRCLIEHGADLNIVDNDGYTPLHTAAAKSSLEVVEYLINQGADIKDISKTVKQTNSLTGSLYGYITGQNSLFN